MNAQQLSIDELADATEGLLTPSGLHLPSRISPAFSASPGENARHR
jgi:hypothetical protein